MTQCVFQQRSRPRCTAEATHDFRLNVQRGKWVEFCWWHVWWMWRTEEDAGFDRPMFWVEVIRTEEEEKRATMRDIEIEFPEIWRQLSG